MPTIYYLKCTYHRDVDANEKVNNSETNSNGHTGMQNNDTHTHIYPLDVISENTKLLVGR